MKLSPEHQRFDVYQNSSQRRIQRVEKPLGTAKTELQTMVCDKIASWVSACRGTPKHSSKTCSARQKCSQVHSNLRYMVWFATKSSPVHQGVDVYQNRPQKFTQRDEKPPGTPSYRLWFATKSTPGHQRVELNRNSPQTRT